MEGGSRATDIRVLGGAPGSVESIEILVLPTAAFIPYQARELHPEAFEADHAVRIVRACYQSDVMQRNNEET